MKMFLTRIGFGKAKGRHRRRHPDRPAQGAPSGLIDAERVHRSRAACAGRLHRRRRGAPPAAGAHVEAYADVARTDEDAEPMAKSSTPRAYTQHHAAKRRPEHRQTCCRPPPRGAGSALRRQSPAELAVRIVDAEEGQA